MTYNVYGPEELPEHIVKYGKRWANRYEYKRVKSLVESRILQLKNNEPNWSFTIIPFTIQVSKDKKVHYSHWYAIYERMVK